MAASDTKHMRETRKRVSLPVMLMLDVLLFAVSLLGFAYFHHVRPQVLITDPQILQQSVIPHRRAYDDTEAGWGEKWEQVFSADGEIHRTDRSYQSRDISIQITTEQFCDSCCYIADIYIRHLENFRSAFAEDSFAKNITEYPQSLTARNHAVLAVNGDYYGIRDTGIILRNYTLYRDVPRGDVAALYYDGTVRTYTADDFDLADAMNDGVYQTFTFGPNLVRNGKALTDIKGAVAGINPRTGFGYYEPGHYCFIVVDGRQTGYSEGLTYDQFAELFGRLGVEEAFNLDGGQSSQMLLENEFVNRPVGYTGSEKSLRKLTDIFYITEVTS